MAQQKTSKLSKSRGFSLDFKLPNRYNLVTKYKTTRGGLKMYRTVTSKTVTQRYEVYITSAIVKTVEKVKTTETFYASFSCAFYHLTVVLSKVLAQS